MNNTIKSIIQLLSKNQKKKSIFFLFLLLCSTILDGISVALIFPILKIITDENYLENLNEKISFIDFAQFGYEKLILISIITVISIYIIKSIYMIFFSYWKSHFIVKMNNEISKRLFKKYIFSSYSYFFEKNSSEFLRNIYSESRYINQAVDSSFRLLIELFSIIVILIILFLFDFKSSFSLLFFFASFFLIFNFISSKKIRIWGFKKQTYVAEIIQTIQQSFGSIKQIILRGNQKFFLKNFNKTLFDLNEQSRKLMFISEIPKNILESLIVLIICFILLLSSFDSENLIDLAPLVGLYFAAALRITPAINRIIASKQAIDSCYPAVKLVNEELSNENILSKPSNFIDKKNYDFKKEINLENITFKYPKSKHPVFKNLNLKIKKNDCICFIGKSGSGKTTLIDLISGLLNPNIGKITLDGREVSLTSDEWKKSIGYVTQSNYLIDDTIKENILFGQNEYSKFDEEKFEKAVKNSQLDVFVNQLSEGINYKVGENGIKLSGGQRQRISIARTLYLNPKILILDEITNSLDKETSASLLDCLNELSGKITIIYITHDDQVIDKANTVYKIEKNKNEESSNLFEIKKR